MTRQRKVACSLALPAASVATSVNRCLRGLSFRYFLGDSQAERGFLSIAHWMVAPTRWR